jgi:hypothetical protein
MLTVVSRALLFLSAFSPLFAIWALKGWGTPAFWVFCGLTVLGIGGTFIVLKIVLNTEGSPRIVNNAEARNSDVAAYVVTYLIPFLTASLQSWTDWVSVGLFILILFSLYVGSDLIGINPVLALAGITLYRVSLDREEPAWMLSRFRPSAGKDVVATKLLADVYIALRRVEHDR